MFELLDQLGQAIIDYIALTTTSESRQNEKDSVPCNTELNPSDKLAFNFLGQYN